MNVLAIFFVRLAMAIFQVIMAAVFRPAAVDTMIPNFLPGTQNALQTAAEQFLLLRVQTVQKAGQRMDACPRLFGRSSPLLGQTDGHGTAVMLRGLPKDQTAFFHLSKQLSQSLPADSQQIFQLPAADFRPVFQNTQNSALPAISTVVFEVLNANVPAASAEDIAARKQELARIFGRIDQKAYMDALEVKLEATVNNPDYMPVK